MAWFRDLAGKKYGNLTVLSTYDWRGSNRRWLCRCDCGKEKVVFASNLTQYHTMSCGCLYKKTRKIGGRKKVHDLTGQHFGRLVVLERSGSRHNKATWLCRCDCGGEAIVATGSLKSGNTTSCGCFHKEVISELFTNHDLTEEERRINRSRGICVPGVHLWRKAVFERDGYRCQVCGESPSNHLVAHHKDGWNWCKERRLDKDNGVTSCTDCHDEFHRTCGWGHNTEQQWLEFVASKRSKEVAA